jgi:hypothetical protein
MQPVSLSAVLDNAVEQLLAYLDVAAKHGDRVLQLRSKLQTSGPHALLDMVVAAQGEGSLSEKAARAMSFFAVDASQQFNDKRTCRGEAIRLCALFTRLHAELNTAA